MSTDLPPEPEPSPQGETPERAIGRALEILAGWDLRAAAWAGATEDDAELRWLLEDLRDVQAVLQSARAVTP